MLIKFDVARGCTRLVGHMLMLADEGGKGGQANSDFG